MIPKNKRCIVLKSVFPLSLMLLLTFSTMNNVLAPINQGTIYSCHSAVAPVVDGTFSSGEWSAGLPVDIFLYDKMAPTHTLKITLMSVYTLNTLYIGVTVPDSTAAGNDRLMILFHTNAANPFLTTAPFIHCNYTKDNDAKMIWVHNNHSVDAYTIGEGQNFEDDFSAGGTEDSAGKCHDIGAEITFELSFPLNSGDALGHDPALAVGDEIDIFCYYYEHGTNVEFYQYRHSDGDYDYNVLHIGCDTAPTTTPPTTTSPPPTTSPPTNTSSITAAGFGISTAATIGIIGSSAIVIVLISKVVKKRKKK